MSRFNLCVCITLMIIDIITGQQCDPTFQVLPNSNLIIGGVARLGCDVATCQSGYTLEWIKWTVTQNGEKDKELKVYSYTSDENQGAEETDDDYDIIGRTAYSNAFGVHTLSVSNLIIYDNGTWSCRAVYPGDVDNNIDEGDVIIPIKPQNTDVQISSKTMYIVEGDIIEFECSVDKVNPQPKVTWAVDDKGGLQGDTHDVINEGYWSVINKILLPFPQVGDGVVKCALRNETDEFVSNTMQVDVKAKAKIENQGGDQETQVDETFSLTCEASGYIPLISWERDGNIILEDDPSFTITTGGTTNQSTSTLTSLPLDPPYTCDNVTDYGGQYRCVATLAEPNQHSSDFSSNMVITILYAPFSPQPNYHEIIGQKGEKKDLPCVVCANPTSLYSWKYGSNAIPVKKEILTINVTAETAGGYTCEASNHIGNEIIYFYVVMEDAGDCLKSGEIAGIVIGVMVAFLIPTAVVFFVLNNRTRKDDKDKNLQHPYKNGAIQSPQEVPGNVPSIYELQEDVQTQELSLPTGEYSELNRTGLYNNARINVYDVLHQTG